MPRSRSRSKSRSPGSRRVFTEKVGRRSRSRSPRDRERRRERRRSRSRSPRKYRRSRSPSPRRYRRSPSPRRRRTRSRSRSPRNSRRTRSRSPDKKEKEEQANVLEDMNLDLDDPGQEDEAMMKLMGFGNFDSTKGKHVEGSCNMSGTSVKKARKYRQYMNRKGGFNRPLDYVA